MNVYIAFPRGLQEAIECRGREEECAKRDAEPHASDVDQYVQSKTNTLKNLNNNFPAILSPDNLANVLRALARKQLAPVLPRDSSCQMPEPTMLNPDLGYTHNAHPTSAQPDILYLTLNVTLVTTTQPHIVILTFVFDRHGDTNYYHSHPFSTAIPLNLSADDINKAFADYATSVGQYFAPVAYGSE